MPISLQPTKDIEANKKNFRENLKMAKGLLAQIQLRSYSAKNFDLSYTSYLRKRIELADHCSKNEPKKLEKHLAELKTQYEKALKLCCINLSILEANQNNCEEMQMFMQYLHEYIDARIAKNTAHAWDEIYNFSQILKRLAGEFAKLKALKNLRADKLEPAIDQYFETKDTKKKLVVELRAKLSTKDARKKLIAELDVVLETKNKRKMVASELKVVLNKRRRLILSDNSPSKQQTFLRSIADKMITIPTSGFGL